MSMDTFTHVLPALPRTRLVFLQGRGEPLLNPVFFQMASLAKAAGCDVGTTTNGTLIDGETKG